MTTPAPTDARLDRIAAMTPHQLAQSHRGRAKLAAECAKLDLEKVRKLANSGDYAASHALITAEAYADRATRYASEAMRAADYGASFETLTEQARAQINAACNLSHIADEYADATHAILRALQHVQESAKWGEITQ